MKKEELTERRFINEREVEAIYGIPRKTLQKYRFFNRGPKFRKFGTARACSVRYAIEDVETWIASLPSGGEQPERMEPGSLSGAVPRGRRA